MTRRTPYLLSAPAAVLLVGLLVTPVVLLVRVSLYEPSHGRGFFAPGTWTMENYAAVTDADGLGRLGFTVAFGAGVAALTLIVSYPIALFIRSRTAAWQAVALGAVLLPKFANALVLLFGLQQLLGPAGPVARSASVVVEPPRLTRNLAGALIGETYLVAPYAVLVLVVHLARIDPALTAAARGLGASRIRAFRRVTWPLSVPGVLLAGYLALMWGLGSFLGPMLLGGPEQTTLSVEVHRQAFEYGRWPRAAAGAVLLVATVGLTLAAYATVTRRREVV